MSANYFNGFDGSDDDDTNSNNRMKLTTNIEYAKSYNNFRKKELLKKYKDRGLDVSESDSDSTSDSESFDEDAGLDTQFDEEFFKMLSSLKSKDPAIYDHNTYFFQQVNVAADLQSESDGDSDGDGKTKKSKPMTLKDYERTIILEKGGIFEDDSDYEDQPEDITRAASPSVVEEERRLRNEFKNVLTKNDSDEEEEFGGIFKKRQKSAPEKDTEEEDFLNWLAGKNEDIGENVKEHLQPLKQYWSSTKLPQSERFLRDYILNQGYNDTSTADIPTYDEIVGDNTPLSEDEQELETQAEFEQKYNFRFEEPDSGFVQRYPRTIEHSVRRTDDKRKQKRAELKERKQHEKEEKMKELKLLKEIKRKEIAEKIEKLKLVTGNDEIGFKDEELEEEFDPEAHDRRMQELFNDDYYHVDEGEEKPECPSDIDELKIEDWDNYNPKQADDYMPHCEDNDFNMDCDYYPATSKQQLQHELITSTKSRKNPRGRRNRFMEMIQAEKPAFNPADEQSYADYIDEYYKMDCEDIIGDTPCRFKYVETTPNDFGLSIEEILLAKNKELNQWASLKKAIQIRPDLVEKKEQRLYKMKAKNEDLKRKIFRSLYCDGSDDEEDNDTTATTIPTETDSPAGYAEPHTNTQSKNNKKRKAKNGSTPAVDGQPVSAVTKEANTEVPTKRLNLDEVSVAQNSTQDGAGETSTVPPASATRKRNKMKKKKNANATTTSGESKKKSEAAKKQMKTTRNPFKMRKNGKSNKVEQVLKRNNGGSNTRPTSNQFAQKPNKFDCKMGRKLHGKSKGDDATNISDDRLKAYGINPRRFHKQQKYGDKQN